MSPVSGGAPGVLSLEVIVDTQLGKSFLIVPDVVGVRSSNATAAARSKVMLGAHEARKSIRKKIH